MTWRRRLHSLLATFIFLLLFLIPLVWSREVNANYYTTKTAFLYFTGGLCFLYLALTVRDFKWPRTTHYLGWIGLFFICLQVLYSLIFNYPLSLFFLPKLFALVGLFVFFNAVDLDLMRFYKKYEWLSLLFWAILLFLTVQNAVELFLENDYFPTGKFMVPFGNTNMMSEFYVLSLPFLYYWVSQKIKINFWIKVFIFAVVNIILLQAQSRAAYLGQCLWWMLYFFEFVKGKKKFIFMALVPLFFYGVTLYHSYMSAPQVEYKATSSAERMNFYRATIDLILDTPLGIGLQYSNKVVPYRLSYPYGPNEFEYPDQPHSELLKWAVELGWIPAIVVLITMGWIVAIVFSRGPFILKGAIFVTGPLLFFQFPFENPASILVLGLYIYLFYRLLPAKQVSLKKGARVLSFFLTAFLVWQSYIFIKSIYNTSHYPNDLELTQNSCDINPVYLPSCIMRNYNLLFAKKYDELRLSLKRDMEANYYNVDFLKIMAALFFESSKTKGPIEQGQMLNKTCEVIHVYRLIFKQQTHFSEADIKACQVVPKPFDFQNPQQFDADYKKWMEKIL